MNIYAVEIPLLHFSRLAKDSLVYFKSCYKFLSFGSVPGRGSHSDWKNGKAFSSQGRPGNFERTGKVRENHTKYWKTQGISEKCYLLFLVKFK